MRTVIELNKTGIFKRKCRTSAGTSLWLGKSRSASHMERCGWPGRKRRILPRSVLVCKKLWDTGVYGWIPCLCRSAGSSIVRTRVCKWTGSGISRRRILYLRADVTEALHAQGENLLVIEVDNGEKSHIYPQVADFTFYGGLYRGVNLILVPEVHLIWIFMGLRDWK